VKVLDWPYSFDRIQRRDGRSKVDGKRVYRHQNTFDRAWVETQTARKERLNKDPLYGWYKMVAGFTRTGLEDDLLEGSADSNSGAASAPFANVRDIAERGFEFAKNNGPLTDRLLVKALGSSKPKELSKSDLELLGLESKRKDLANFVQILQLYLLGERPEPDEPDLIEALRSARASVGVLRLEAMEAVPSPSEWADSIGWGKPSNLTLQASAVPPRRDAFLKELNDDIAALSNLPDRVDKAAYEAIFGLIAAKPYHRLFLDHERLRSAFYKREHDMVNERIQQNDEQRQVLGPMRHAEQERLLNTRNIRALRGWANARLVLDGVYPDEFIDRNIAHVRLQNLLQKPDGKPPTLEEILLWDSTYNNGEIQKDISDSIERQKDANDGGRGWVGLPENLGMFIPKDIFVAAINAAFSDVEAVSGVQNVPLIDLQTHKRVSTQFARLCAEHVKLIRADNPTRNETEKRITRIMLNIRMLKRLFKKLNYSPEDGFLYFSSVQHPQAYAERDQRSADRDMYQRQAKRYYSDVYNVEDIVAQRESGGAALLNGSTSLGEVVRRTNLLPWQAAREYPRVSLTGDMRRSLAEDEEIFDNL